MLDFEYVLLSLLLDFEYVLLSLSLSLSRLDMRRDVGDISIQASSSTTKRRRKKKINTMSTHARPPTRVWTLPRSAIPLVAGFVSGMTARVLVNPLDVLKVRLQAAQPGTYTNAVNAASRIIRQDGLRALMRGVQPGILLWAPYTAIQVRLSEGRFDHTHTHTHRERESLYS